MQAPAETHLAACIRAALAGAQQAHAAAGPDLTGTTKNDTQLGHHSIVTPADYASQRAILAVLAELEPDARIMTEEVLQDPRWAARAIGPDRLDLFATSGVFVIDELDGSSSCASGHHEWSVSVAYVESLRHEAGAVVAPRIDGGTLFFASSGGGAFAQLGSGPAVRLHVRRPVIEDAYILVGPDVFVPEFPLHNELLLNLGGAARTVNGCGSCALALGLVAAGRADALVQSPQRPWDWAAGRVLVEEAGGSFTFYEDRPEGILLLDGLSPRHYDPERRGVGFVAGDATLVAEIVSRLRRTTRKA